MIYHPGRISSHPGSQGAHVPASTTISGPCPGQQPLQATLNPQCQSLCPLRPESPCPTCPSNSSKAKLGSTPLSPCPAKLTSGHLPSCQLGSHSSLLLGPLGSQARLFSYSQPAISPFCTWLLEEAQASPSPAGLAGHRSLCLSCLLSPRLYPLPRSFMPSSSCNGCYSPYNARLANSCTSLRIPLQASAPCTSPPLHSGGEEAVAMHPEPTHSLPPFHLGGCRPLCAHTCFPCQPTPYPPQPTALRGVSTVDTGTRQGQAAPRGQSPFTLGLSLPSIKGTSPCWSCGVERRGRPQGALVPGSTCWRLQPPWLLPGTPALSSHPCCCPEPKLSHIVCPCGRANHPPIAQMRTLRLPGSRQPALSPVALWTLSAPVPWPQVSCLGWGTGHPTCLLASCPVNTSVGGLG